MGSVNHNAFVSALRDNVEGNLGPHGVSKDDAWEGGLVSISLDLSFSCQGIGNIIYRRLLLV